ncbi:MAG: FmdB family transcriptional regulator [Acidobacteria bacterium]|nr:MAG: FmdB family transcriptional regulator [Acidobacteriota bacterium]
MPIYEYECRGCGHRFEYLVLPSSSVPACPSCQHQDLQRLISICAVSSESTRQAHLSSARKKSAAVQREKQHEEHKLIHKDD